MACGCWSWILIKTCREPVPGGNLRKIRSGSETWHVSTCKRENNAAHIDFMTSFCRKMNMRTMTCSSIFDYFPSTLSYVIMSWRQKILYASSVELLSPRHNVIGATVYCITDIVNQLILLTLRCFIFVVRPTDLSVLLSQWIKWLKYEIFICMLDTIFCWSLLKWFWIS